jgi:hypothetical protein
MMKITKVLSVFAILIAAGILNTAAARADWGVLGGATIFNPSNITNNSNTGFAGGIFIRSGGTIGPSLEVDALYDGRSLGGTTLKTLQVPAFIRLYFLPLMNIGLGAYYAQGIGSDDSNAGLKSSDFGLDGSLQVRIPLTGMTHFIIDARYLYGLTDIVKVGDSKTREVNILGGFSFGY